MRAVVRNKGEDKLLHFGRHGGIQVVLLKGVLFNVEEEDVAPGVARRVGRLA